MRASILPSASVGWILRPLGPRGNSTGRWAFAGLAPGEEPQAKGLRGW